MLSISPSQWWQSAKLTLRAYLDPLRSARTVCWHREARNMRNMKNAGKIGSNHPLLLITGTNRMDSVNSGPGVRLAVQFSVLKTLLRQFSSRALLLTTNRK